MGWREKTEVEKAIAFEAIRPHMPDVWTLLEIVERTNPPEHINDEGSDLTLGTDDGWQVSYFYDVGELDYIDEIRSPEGIVFSPWDWPIGAPGGSMLRAWGSVGCRARLMAIRERAPVRTIDCTDLGPEAEIAVSEQERDDMWSGDIEILGGFLDEDRSRILRIPVATAG